MAQGIIFLALLLSTLVMSLKEDAQSTDYDYDDDYYDDPVIISDSEEIQETEDTTAVPLKTSKGVQTKSPTVFKPARDREELTTERQVAMYEVTELVIDIPDVNSRRVPILTNFTLTKPLNFAGVPNNKTNYGEANTKNEGDETINSILISNKPKVNTKFYVKKDENDYISNLSPEDTFEEEFDKEFHSDEDEFDNFETKEDPKPHKSFKDHFHNFGKNIVNEFKSVVNKHKDGIHDSLRKFVNGPISFFSKLHKKSSDLADKLHNAGTRDKFHDQDNHDYLDDK